MALPPAKLLLRKLVFCSASIGPCRFSTRRLSISGVDVARSVRVIRKSNPENDKKVKQKSELLLKKRTRSNREVDKEWFIENFGNGKSPHVPVMLGEVLDVFSSVPLKSFVDCTLGAGGHSSAIILEHPEMEFYVGLDVDPVAHKSAQAHLANILESHNRTGVLQVHTLSKNFKYVKSVLHEIGGRYNASGVDGIFMDLGVSSMQVDNVERGFSVMKDGPLDMRMNPQASLKAEDIVNTWPAAEIGRILRDYGEESNWLSLQNKIVKARLSGGLHSTGELADLIRGTTSPFRGGRQGWIKKATRVFQALRIAVNDELNTLKDSIFSSFDCLAPGGKLAIISFHSLEDRIVKQAFLEIVQHGDNADNSQFVSSSDVHGNSAQILTKRPITPSESEEELNPRSRSAKLRVIQKI